MRQFKEDLVERLIDLYNIYERYMWKHDDTKLDILIQDNSVSFYLYNSQEDLDEIIIDFSDKEKALYKHVSVRILLMILRDVVVYQDDNIFYNDVHKPYLKLIVNDDEIKNIMRELILRQHKEFITSDTDVIKDINDSVRFTLFYPSKFMNRLDERIGLSRKMLRNGCVR